MVEWNKNALKEPKGFIRVIQMMFALFAYVTTQYFYGESALDIYCPSIPASRTRPYKLRFGFPFELEKNEFRYLANCTEDIEAYKAIPMDFSSSAIFYVVMGMFCKLYCFVALAFYIYGFKSYATNPVIPMLDLVITGILTIFWFAGACAWAVGVSDLKYYTNPSYFKQLIPICKEARVCSTNKVASWTLLNVSLIFGFANVFLWGSSMWFIYKETSLYSKSAPPMSPQQGSFGGYEDPIEAHPKSGNQYQNVQQQFTGQDGDR